MVEIQNRGRLGEIRDEGDGRTQGVNKMDPTANSKSQQWKEKVEKACIMLATRPGMYHVW